MSDLEKAVAALEAFLAQMRREHIARYGMDQPIRVPVLANLNAAERMALIRSMNAAMKAVETAEKAL